MMTAPVVVPRLYGITGSADYTVSSSGTLVHSVFRYEPVAISWKCALAQQRKVSVGNGTELASISRQYIYFSCVRIRYGICTYVQGTRHVLREREA